MLLQLKLLKLTVWFKVKMHFYNHSKIIQIQLQRIFQNNKHKKLHSKVRNKTGNDNAIGYAINCICAYTKSKKI